MTATDVVAARHPRAWRTACLRTHDGERLLLPVERWFGPPTDDEHAVLERAEPPVLDVGCGPGRHVLALAARGIPVLGIDVARSALGVARAHGAPVLERSVFGRIPAAGRWSTALLLDGNVGIGGDPAVLLRRIAALLRAGGRVLVEVEAPGTRLGVEEVRLEIDGDTGPWFRWARCGADGLAHVAERAGLAVDDVWCVGTRWFGQLRR